MSVKSTLKNLVSTGGLAPTGVVEVGVLPASNSEVEVPSARVQFGGDGRSGPVKPGEEKGNVLSDFSAPLPPADYTNRNVLSADEQQQITQLLTAKNVRLLPFPFGSAISIVSDLDGSLRPQYNAYVGLLVDRFGLDFGDSTWLRWQNRHGVRSGFGFFSHLLSAGQKENPDNYVNIRTFNENVAEYHKGNVDHFHAFLSRGPRVALPRHLTLTEDSALEIRFSEFQGSGFWSATDFFVFGICIVTAPGETIAVRSISVHERDGTVTDAYRHAEYEGPPDGREHRLFVIHRPATDEAWVPALDNSQSIRVEFDAPGDAAKVERVLLTNSYGEILVERLRYLRDSFNVQLSLFTEHGGLHFRNPTRSRVIDRLLKQHIETYAGPLEAYNGSVVDDNGDLIFSTDADNPFSFCRVFPDISKDQEARFIVPHAAARSTGWSIFDVISPSPTRAGGGIYWAQRTLPNVVEPKAGKRYDSHSRQSSFSARLARVLEHAEREPGWLWPIYTHLGGLTNSVNKKLPWLGAVRTSHGDDSMEAEADVPADARAIGLPDPYFALASIEALQDRVFNISGAIPPKSRSWFVNATFLYDYALIMRSVVEHIHHDDNNTVQISSWFDHVLGKKMPRSPAQLYGLTFYVRDQSKAEVYLDGRPIEYLVRNNRDETGRASVTIAAADIRHVVFDRLDPRANLPDETMIEAGEWSWNTVGGEADSFGRLSIAQPVGKESANPSEPRRATTLKLPLYDWSPTGAQCVVLKFRVDASVQIGFLFETQSGGSFFFGDKRVAALLPRDPTAWNFFHPRYRQADEWRVLTLPFHDLTWASDAKPGGPMPNHALTSLTIYCVGLPRSGVDVGRIEFLRPRCSPQQGRDTSLYCLGGRLPVFEFGQTVKALAIHSPFADSASAVVDQRGQFCFGVIPPGLYRVWSTTDGGQIHDRRGALVELYTNVMTLVLDRFVPKPLECDEADQIALS